MDLTNCKDQETALSEEYEKLVLHWRRVRIRTEIVERRRLLNVKLFQNLRLLLADMDYCAAENSSKVKTVAPSSHLKNVLTPPQTESESSLSSTEMKPLSYIKTKGFEEEQKHGPSSSSIAIKPPLFHHKTESIEEEQKKETSARGVEEEKQDDYPKEIGDYVILGPNGTVIHINAYNSIEWWSVSSATRQILSFLFTDDTLATHTLSGRPSPAFRGRERPPKTPLDRKKVDDIIYIVRSKLQCTSREIRAAITTKCSDAGKKYKKFSQKNKRL